MMPASVPDALGRVHPPAGPEARIVSLVPSLTELLFALELGPQVVGRTGFCIHPAEAVRAVPKLGGTKDVNVDALRELAPTHVLLNIDENEQPLFEALEQFVPHVIVTHPIEVEDNFGLYALLGSVFGRQAQAEALLAALRAELMACARAGWRWRRVLYLIWRDPWMTVSSRTYIARMLAQVRLTAVAPPGDDRYPTLELPGFDPERFDAVLLSSEPYRFGARHVEELAAQPGLAGRPVLMIDGEMTSWYGVRAIDGLRYLRGFRDELDGACAAPAGEQHR
jgi:ABC-type Fe3+-hydroxamate transport system substrate-binding protein